MWPKSLTNTINAISSIPGISKKQAERIAIYLVSKDGIENRDEIIDAVKTLDNIVECNTCHFITDKPKCDICSDKTRDRLLVVVESSIDVAKFELNDTYKPYYHVIGKLPNVKKDVDYSELNIDDIKKRLGSINEIILALSPNLSGILVSNYIKDRLSDFKNITQLAQGIPLGAAMEYIDEHTLKLAMKNRKEVK